MRTIPFMNSQRTLSLLRWTLAGAVLAGIVLVYRRWLHVNTTTVALTLLLYVLVLSALWGLRYAVVMSLFATAAYNFYFLPPTNTFTVNDPQNWLALFALLFTSIIASKLSQRAREDAAEARSGQRELEMAVPAKQRMMQTDSVASLLASVPSAVASATTSPAAALFLAEGERLYQIGDWSIGSLELPHLAKTAEAITACRTDADQLQVPVRSGVRVKGLLLLRAAELSMATADAIGSLIAVSIERAQALETVARGAAAKESERTALGLDRIQQAQG